MTRPIGTSELGIVREIPPGLSRVPYQLGCFGEFRASLIEQVAQGTAFGGWRPQADDPGLMLLEAWAYAADVVSFYEEYVVNESLLRTAIEPESPAELVAVLGHVPRPALAHRSRLVADISRPLTLPAGMPVKSEAVEGGPQTFELDGIRRFTRDDVPVRLGGAVRRPGTPVTTAVLYAESRGLRIRERQWVAITNASSGARDLRRVTRMTTVRDASGRRVVRLTLNSSISYVELADVEVLAPSAQAIVEDGHGTGTLTLDRRYDDLSGGDLVLADGVLSSVSSVQAASVERRTGQDRDADGNVRQFNARIPVTRVSVSGISARRFEYRFENVASLVEAASAVAGSDAAFDGLGLTRDEPFTAMLVDARGQTAFGLFEEREGVLIPHFELNATLYAPYRLYPGVVEATQGQSHTETLATSTGSVRQQYALGKKPLTYLSDRDPSTAHGFASTLEIWVDGIRWREVPSFFGRGPHERVFVCRQVGEDTWVQFGDGERGVVPVRGASVEARYRYGAAGPDLQAGQLNKPDVKPAGLVALFNPERTWSGAPAEQPSQTQDAAPLATLTLGRVVSTEDLAAHARLLPDVGAAAARWVWDEASQRAAAHLWYLGPEETSADVFDHVREACDPTVPLRVRPATRRAVHLRIDIEAEEDFDVDRVVAHVGETLAGEDGMLLPELLGIGTPLIRSDLFEAIHQVEGVAHVRSVSVGRSPFIQPAVVPGPAEWLDFFEDGALWINGEEVQRG